MDLSNLKAFSQKLLQNWKILCALSVTGVIKATVEAALVEELESFRSSGRGPQARRSGYFHRLLDTQYGRIPKLRVPKLRDSNSKREWQILRELDRKNHPMIRHYPKRYQQTTSQDRASFLVLDLINVEPELQTAPFLWA